MRFLGGFRFYGDPTDKDVRNRCQIWPGQPSKRMINSPQWILLLAPFALLGGITFRTALFTGGTLPWCMFTASFMGCLGILIMAIAYVRSSILNDKAQGGDYFDEWPRELDVLLSNASKESRILAARHLREKAKGQRWRYRVESIKVLRSVSNGKDRDIASAVSATLKAFENSEIANGSQRFFREPPSHSERFTRKGTPHVGSSRTLSEYVVILIDKPAKEILDSVPEERACLAIERAKLNREEFCVEPQVAREMARRIKGKDWVQIKTIEELRLVSSEPWVFLCGNAVSINQDAVVTLDFWQLHETLYEFHAETQIPLVGDLGLEVLNALKNDHAPHVAA